MGEKKPSDDPIVSSGTTEDGKRVAIHKSTADAIWASIAAAKAKRLEIMPTEQDARDYLNMAHTRLKELGWMEPCYGPKDRSPLDIIELGSTGIHRGYYEGQWPTGSWWVYDDDHYPSSPALVRPHHPQQTKE